jgi:hypothetical protein|tara:strand:+ start:3274 stop:3528 length:255 start_codon:yes stop_codon:yes gene_type:complete
MKEIQYNEPTASLISKLVGSTVRYLAEKSQVKSDGVRVFKVEAVEEVGFSAKGKRFAKCLVSDVDQEGQSVYRNLSVAGIELIV